MQNNYLDYISHHGILGQKHGVRNGPPYPLSPEDYSATEKKLAKATKKYESYKKKSEKYKGKALDAKAKSAKLDQKAYKNKLKGAAAIRTSISDSKLEKAQRQEALSLKLIAKSAKLEVKSLKYSKKAEDWLKDVEAANEDIKLSDLYTAGIKQTEDE